MTSRSRSGDDNITYDPRSSSSAWGISLNIPATLHSSTLSEMKNKENNERVVIFTYE